MQFKTQVNQLDKQRFLELLRAHLVIAGGGELTDEKLLSTSLMDLLELCFNNGVVLRVELEPRIFGAGRGVIHAPR